MKPNLKFKQRIDRMKYSGAVLSRSGNNDLLKVEDKKGARFYAYDPNDPSDFLGKGSFGSVHKAYPVDPETGEVDYGKPVTVKVIKKSTFYATGSHEEIIAEAAKLRSLYKAEPPIETTDDYFLISEYFPGVTLTNNLSIAAPEIKPLSFEQRVNLINELVLSYNILHHNTPATGPAAVHLDIKGPNVIVEFQNNSNRVNVYPFDFGMTHTLKEEGAEEVINKIKGTLVFQSPEASESISEKVDVYALVGIATLILGATNPLSAKTKAFNELKGQGADIDHMHKVVRRVNFTRDGMFADFQMPPYPHDIKSLISNFLNRMEDHTVSKRASSDETLRFFTSLNQYCKIFNNNPEDKEGLSLNFSKMLLLSNGLWGTKLGEQKIADIKKQSNTEEIAVEETILRPKTFEQHPFNQPVEFAANLKMLSEKNLLNERTLNALALLDEKNLLADVNSVDDLQRLHAILQQPALNNLHLNNEKIFIKSLLVFNKEITDTPAILDKLILLDKYHILKNDLSLLKKDGSPGSVTLREVSLRKLSKAVKKYNFNINDITSDQYSKIFAKLECNPKEALKAFLTLYIEQRNQDVRGNNFSFWSKKGGFDKAKKTSAAEDCIKILDGEEIEIPAAAKQGRLGSLLKDFGFKQLIQNNLSQKAKLNQG